MSPTKLFKSAINYLKYKAYYFKYYHPFAFSHKPLCEKFEQDTIHLLNKIYVCRSCFLLYSSLFLTLSLAFYNHFINIIEQNIISVICFIFTVLLLTNPNLYKKYFRFQRDIMRSSNGIIIALTLIILAKVNFVIGIFLFTTLFLIKKLYNKTRSTKDICAGCAELSSEKTCAGYKKQVEALLILEENYSKTLTIRKEYLYD